MGRRRSLRGAFFSATLLACAVMSPARADQVPPISLLPSLDVYVDWLLAARAAAMACAEPSSLARDDKGWANAKAVFLASLWAGNFPFDFVRKATIRLDGSGPDTKPDCHDEAVQAELAPLRSGWLEEIRRVLKSLDLPVVERPVSAAKWQSIKDVIAEDVPKEARLLECAAVSFPSMLPLLAHDWNDMIVKIGGELSGAGLPRDEIVATLGNAEANAIWQRAPSNAESALRKSCAEDKGWQDRFYNFEFLALRGKVEKLLPASEPTSP